MQQLSYSCGPCSILNILHQKGNFEHSERSLVRLCNAKPGIGSANDDVINTCKLVGLKIVQTAENASIHDIEVQLDANSYVIVNYFQVFSGEGHYAVIADHDNNAFYLMDSSLGLLRLRKEYFKKYWHNSDKSIYGWYVAVK